MTEQEENGKTRYIYIYSFGPTFPGAFKWTRVEVLQETKSRFYVKPCYESNFNTFVPKSNAFDNAEELQADVRDEYLSRIGVIENQARLMKMGWDSLLDQVVKESE